MYDLNNGWEYQARNYWNLEKNTTR
jgi:hypothetical protein